MKKIEQVKKVKASHRQKVAAYARVSRDTERLNHSLSTQVSYYNKLIGSNPAWAFAGIYVDHGISGTSTRGREEFQRMIRDCYAGKIDLILCKSISRFARNTVDLLETIRGLKALGIAVHFEKEHIDTLSGDGELMLTILASFAQEESRSISENAKWSIRKGYEQGRPHIHFAVYGYRWEGDDLFVVPQEREVVHHIFDSFLRGNNSEEITRELYAMGAKTRKGKPFAATTVRAILTNDIYTGDLRLQKGYIADTLTHKRKVNTGQLTQYLVENDHEAIVSHAVFDAVQAERRRRQECGVPKKDKYLFTEKLKCAACGRFYGHSVSAGHAYWRCRGKINGVCKAPTISEEKLKHICCETLGMAEFDKDTFDAQVAVVHIYPDRMQFVGDKKVDVAWRRGK